MHNTLTFLIVFLFTCHVYSQDGEGISIHRFESEKYSRLAGSDLDIFDSINSYQACHSLASDYTPLQRRVFGYHPYWGGSNYLNYQWELLSDLCYFSYEVDPVTGFPLTTHDWDTSPAIDSALSNGVKVHLCVTLFSGHSVFFSNPEAMQNLIEQIIFLLSERGAHGVNMDVEALPFSQKEAFLEFMIDLCEQMNEQLPDSEVSIAAPAVNWSGKFNIPVLNESIDFFMVMGYDYYWPGSGQAGPVSPLFPMTGSYDYSFSRTISYYQSQGVAEDKLIMGVPYYAYQWKTAGQYAPSVSLGTGAAYTYRKIKDNANGHYSYENKHIEPNSFGPYYAFESNGWNQCFMDDVYSLGEKYDQINRRDLAGLGIWALGYDNGYVDLWNLIAEKFTADAMAVDADTIYDNGGPAHDYYDNEAYTYTIRSTPGSSIYLSFTYLDTESGYDTLWIYDGDSPSSPVMGIFSGDEIPELFHASSSALTLRFFSDNATVDAGWRAVYDTLPVSAIHEFVDTDELIIRPNPASGFFSIEISQGEVLKGMKIQILDVNGVVRKEIRPESGTRQAWADASHWMPGLYLAVLYRNKLIVGKSRFIVK